MRAHDLAVILLPVVAAGVVLIGVALVPQAVALAVVAVALLVTGIPALVRRLAMAAALRQQYGAALPAEQAVPMWSDVGVPAFKVVAGAALFAGRERLADW